MEAVVAVAATVVEVVEAVEEAAEEDSPARMQRPWVGIAAGREMAHKHRDVGTQTQRCRNTNTGHLSLHTGSLPLAFFAIPI